MTDTFDLVVQGGRVVTPDGVRKADVGIAEGKFAKIAPQLSAEGGPAIDAAGGYVFPGVIDAHVHFNEPGRTEWEGLASGSSALAAGGGACFFDMPLNSEPPVLGAEQFRMKRAVAENKSRLDFALWGGLVPGNLDRLPGLGDEGAIGLKAFLCPSGIESFPPVDAASLRAGMRRAKELGLVVAVHAEDAELTAALTEEQRSRGGASPRAFLASRPVEAELRAIRLALELAGETGCALHVVHVSNPEGVALINRARQEGLDVSAETCPHYLLLNEGDLERIGAPAKCAPPVRDEARRREMWQLLRTGNVHTIGSDHSPAPPKMKAAGDFFEIWGGIAGCQHGFELLFSETAGTRDRDLPALAVALAHNPARRFGLGGKGMVEEGYDADFTVIHFGPEREIRAEELLTRHRISPYVGRRSQVRISHTFVRGRAAWAEGKLVEPAPKGKFLRGGRRPPGE